MQNVLTFGDHAKSFSIKPARIHPGARRKGGSKPWEESADSETVRKPHKHRHAGS